MTTIEKIKAEIERQMKFYYEKEMKAWDDSERGDEDALWYQGHRKMCAKLLSFISTLESEKPVPNDLEEVAEKEAIEYAKRQKPKDADGEIWRVGDVMIENRMSFEDGFIAGAKWQKEQDLAEMAQSKSPLSVAYANRCFENGKQAMKEQMMKEAVEGELEYNYDENGRAYYSIRPTWITGKIGDKVRIIIVKEDEK